MVKLSHALPALLLGSITLQAAMIKDIRYKGLIHISPNTAAEISGLRKGEQLDIVKIDNSIKKFFNYGYFADIYVTEEKGVVTYHFKEKSVIANVDIVGYDDSKSEELLKNLALKKGDLYDREVVEKARQKLTSMIEEQGYYDTVVVVDKKVLNDESLKIDFVVNRGERIIIDEVVMNGAKTFDFEDVRNSVANRSRQVMGWLIGRDSGELKSSDLMVDHARIEDYYKRHGYIDARVAPAFLKVNQEQYKAQLSYNIREGEKYSVGDISIKLKQNVVDPQNLYNELILKKGLTFNIERVRKDIRTIATHVKDKGYANAQIVPDFRKNPENKSVDIVFKVDPGKPVYIRDIYISGNSVTQDKVIRREMLLAPNDLYSATDLKDSKNALGRTGFFESVNVEERKVSADQIDLFVKVKEAPTGSLTVGGGYGSYDGFLLSGSVSDRNIFGSGIDGSISGELSKHSQNFNISFQNPRLFDSLYSLGGTAFNGKFEGYDYDEKKMGLGVNIGRKLDRNTHARIAYNYTDVKLSDLTSSLSSYYDRAHYRKSSIVPSISFNNTDDYILPREGINTYINDEFAGVGGDAKFNKITTGFKYYYGLNDDIDYDMILRYKLKASYLSDNGYVPLNDKLYLGGISTLRGYEPRSLAPKNSDGALTGGDRYITNSLEASIPLIQSARMRLGMFYDYGMTGQGDFDIKRSSVGGQLEWQSPMGAVQLIFANPIDSKDGDRTAAFEFTMGRSF
jgi:outer membrane protein insertion porin family